MLSSRSIGFSALAVAAAGQAAMAQGGVWATGVGQPGANDRIEVLFASGVSGQARLYSGGDFSAIGGVSTPYIASWDGEAWSRVGSNAVNGTVLSIATFDDGSGPHLYASGLMWSDSQSAQGLMQLSDGLWSSLPRDAEAPSTWVGFIRGVPTTSGTRLWASGGFGVYLTSWGGTEWDVPNGGLSSVIHDAATFNDGDTEKLYLTGSFPTAGSVQVRQFASWDGAAFAIAGGGINGAGYALAVWNDGRGDALYIGGTFSAVGQLSQQVQARNVARWDGQHWEPLGSGTNNVVNDLAVFDDGSGPKLYATGTFTTAGSVAAAKLARWDGQTWSPVGAGLTGSAAPDGHALQVFDADGDGPTLPRLFVAGEFSAAGGQPAANIAALVPCRAEMNGDGALGVPDVFAYLSLWFAGEARADFDGVPGVGVPDIFAFLSAWFAGCA